MKGSTLIEKIGKKVIEIVRQRCCQQYGSAIVVQKEVRNITQKQDRQRCYYAMIRIDYLRRYYKAKGQAFLLGTINYIKCLNQLQAGNCGEMNWIVFRMMSSIVPVGVKVQFRIAKTQNHSWISIKPHHAQNEDQTFILDPWPSYQRIKAEVPLLKDYYYGSCKSICEFGQEIQQISFGGKKFNNLDAFSEGDFNMQILTEVQKILDKNQRSAEPEWKIVSRMLRNQPSFKENMSNPRHLQTFEDHLRSIRNIKYVTKNQNRNDIVYTNR